MHGASPARRRRAAVAGGRSAPSRAACIAVLGTLCAACGGGGAPAAPTFKDVPAGIELFPVVTVSVAARGAVRVTGCVDVAYAPDPTRSRLHYLNTYVERAWQSIDAGGRTVGIGVAVASSPFTYDAAEGPTTHTHCFDAVDNDVSTGTHGYTLVVERPRSGESMRVSNYGIRAE